MSESIVSQKFTKIHMVKMISCVTGLDLRDSVKVVEDHLKIEDLQLMYDNPIVIEGREKIQDDLLCKMLNNNIKNELEKRKKLREEVDRMDDEIHELTVKRNNVMDNLLALG